MITIKLQNKQVIEIDASDAEMKQARKKWDEGISNLVIHAKDGSEYLIVRRDVDLIQWGGT